MKKILISLTYYLPNVSGITIYADTLAKKLAKNNQVTILTSKFQKKLPTTKTKNNIFIRRVWAPIKINKGIIMPLFPVISLLHVLKNDIVICNLPQLESFWLILWGKILEKKTIIVHHCEFGDAPEFTKKLIKYITYIPHYISYLLVDQIVTYTRDYANHSIFLSKFKNKIKYLLPPVTLEAPNKIEIQKLKNKYNLKKKTKVVGFVGRIGWEKGIDLILNSIPNLKHKFKDIKFMFVGPYQHVVGDKTFQKLEKLFKKYQKNIILTGQIDEHSKLVNYYYLFDCLVLPSTNNLETFGIVQPEAMLCGCPVVASNLPGVRVPIQKTGMGKIIPVGKQLKLAEAIIWCIKNNKKLLKKQPEAKEIFSIDKFFKNWEKLI